RGHVAATRAPADDGGPRLLAGVPLGAHRPAHERPEGPHGPVFGPSPGGAAVSFLRNEARPAHRDGPPRTRRDLSILHGTRSSRSREGACMWATASKGIPASSCPMPRTWLSRGTALSARSLSRIGWGRPSSGNSGWRRIVEVGGSVGPCWRQRWAVSQIVTNR